MVDETRGNHGVDVSGLRLKESPGRPATCRLVDSQDPVWPPNCESWKENKYRWGRKRIKGRKGDSYHSWEMNK